MDLHPVQGNTPLTAVQLAEHDLEELAAMSVRALGFLVQFSESENIRYKAATYILDKVLGRATDVPMSKRGEEEDILKEFVAATVTYSAG